MTYTVIPILKKTLKSWNANSLKAASESASSLNFILTCRCLQRPVVGDELNGPRCEEDDEDEDDQHDDADYDHQFNVFPPIFSCHTR